MRPSTNRRVRSVAGFTLLELVIVLSILAVLAGAAVPMASRFVLSKSRAATRQELDELAEAVGRYFEDTWTFPGALDDLTTNPGASGWCGPYVDRIAADPWSGATDTTVDAWARPYRLRALSSSRLEIRSSGEDTTFGDASDLVIEVDTTPSRRERTREQIALLNAAISRYRELYPDTPLPSLHADLVDDLVGAGLLPTAGPWLVDGWGSAFTADPPGMTPVVAVTSAHL